MLKQTVIVILWISINFVIVLHIEINSDVVFVVCTHKNYFDMSRNGSPSV